MQKHLRGAEQTSTNEGLINDLIKSSKRADCDAVEILRHALCAAQYDETKITLIAFMNLA